MTGRWGKGCSQNLRSSAVRFRRVDSPFSGQNDIDDLNVRQSLGVFHTMRSGQLSDLGVALFPEGTELGLASSSSEFSIENARDNVEAHRSPVYGHPVHINSRRSANARPRALANVVCDLLGKVAGVET